MFEPIVSIIKQRKKEFSFSQEIKAVEVLDIWQKVIEDIFNKDIREKCKSLSFKQGVLKVRVENSVLSQELQLRRGEIKDIINKKLKRGSVGKVEKIIFQL